MRWRCETAYVGEGGIQADRPYHCIKGKVEEVCSD
jgi:hypothetical protein